MYMLSVSFKQEQICYLSSFPWDPSFLLFEQAGKFSFAIIFMHNSAFADTEMATNLRDFFSFLHILWEMYLYSSSIRWTSYLF